MRGVHEKTQGTHAAGPQPVAAQPIVVSIKTPAESHEQVPARNVRLVLMLRWQLVQVMAAGLADSSLTGAIGATGAGLRTIGWDWLGCMYMGDPYGDAAIAGLCP